MLYLKRILLPVDLSEASGFALHVGLSLAVRMQAELHLLHLQMPTPQAATSPHNVFQDWFRTVSSQPHLRHLLSELEAPLQRVSQQTTFASEGILRYAQQKEIDLVLMGLNTPMAAVTEAVVRQAACPVLTLPELAHPKRLPTIGHILAPTDFSDCSQHAVLHARELAARFQARLTLLHVAQPPTLLHFDPNLHPLFHRTQHPEFLRRQLQNLYERLPGPTAEVAFETTSGAVANGIARFAAEQAVDLIVISTHGVTGVRYFALGSVTEQVVRLASCPVFTVKAFSKSLVAASPADFVQPALTGFTTMLHEWAAEPEPVVALEPARMAPNRLPLVRSQMPVR
jgi:nucleotide-binding universal stress UspA family protein